jgi:hypothetical protein
MPLRAALIGLATAVALTLTLAPSAPAATAKTHRCASADLRYAFAKGQPKRFGVFALTERGTVCATARSLARIARKAIEADKPVPKHSLGFAVTTRAPAAQTVAVTARRGTALVRFTYVVANG